MQADDAPLEEGAQRHAVPTVVVGIAYHEARKHEEEINGQIAVVDDLHQMVAARMGLEQVEDDYHQRGYATQAVQYLVVRLRSKVSGLCLHENVLFG